MNCRGLFLIFLLANCSGWLSSSVAADQQNCPVTRPSDRPFVPPQPYSPTVGSNEFLYGSAALRTIVYPGWHVHMAGSCPFFEGLRFDEGGTPATNGCGSTTG